ncbi:hypothetical protein KJY73_10360 [Bowmanella sp. Y26]|uniref:ORC-CDC6 family AAA ATPase n=1 Tax=Bowmanella yangjiangensis TaxID=2811230 RepID=UPI001BDD9FCE|nr:hypothetical protein [Bowmanella yangjiangensis]MBT1063978.1 hypothetical protein [Bowmanella yangjiangensis]
MVVNFTNPFEVRTPEALSAQEVAKLFVDVFSDFKKVDDQSHTFIQGPRGTGKSMMLRYMEPDVQIAACKAARIQDLEFFALHIPIKKAWSDITEWDLLDGTMYQYLAEHLMISHITYCLFRSLSKNIEISDLDKGVLDYLNSLLIGCGSKEINIDELCTLGSLTSHFHTEFNKIKSFVKRLMFSKPETLDYDGGLLSYLDFLVPLLEKLKEQTWGCGGPFYLMIDDADLLDVRMQRILNTWVSCRTIDSVCLKVATQNRYATYRTIDGKLIESPHDYSEVNISELYTRKENRYAKRVKDIIEKRLELVGIHVPVEEFFPEDLAQREKIEEIKCDLKSKHEAGKGRGTRASDDVIRYATPIYMSMLAGKRKSSSTYSYAGFKSMVDLSSGIIRWFIDPAAKMFGELISSGNTQSKDAFTKEGKIAKIPPSIQDKVLKEWSYSFIDDELPKIEDKNEVDVEHSVYSKVHNLLVSLGMLFRERLLDEQASERKLLSFVLANPEALRNETKKILSLAVDLGYLQYSSHGSKEGIGRKPKYTLSHRLAPYFQLDPSGYAYSMSITSEILEIALVSPNRFVRSRLKGNDSSSLFQASLDI